MNITIIKNASGPLSKSFTLKDGKLVKAAAAELVNGSARRVEVRDIRHLADVAIRLGSDEALTFGVSRFARAQVTTQKRNANKNADIPLICRDRAHFSWPTGPGVLMLDIDKPKDGSAPLKARAFDTMLATLLPWWRTTARFYRPSASAFIFDANGNEMSGPGSLRAYAIVDIAANIPFVGIAIADALWKAGMGRIEFSAAGSMLPRCPVDTAVWQPERLDFAGPAVIGPGLVQRKYPPLVIDGDAIRSAEVMTMGKFTVAQWQNQSAEVKAAKAAMKPEEQKQRRAYVSRKVNEDIGKGVAPKEADKRWRRVVYGQQLGPEFELQLRDGELVKVRDILADPQKYNQQRCADPMDPEYADDDRIALICVNHRNGLVYSHAHGGVKYELSTR